ncbi:MAG: Do family serine endopeptidase [Spirochaetia bacterium]|nr:Do family serine endopeptidase [Spirochaetia bacterium]MCF7946353.1 Do family serine endopeptidase [Spirochaetia bacterium]
MSTKKDALLKTLVFVFGGIIIGFIISVVMFNPFTSGENEGNRTIPQTVQNNADVNYGSTINTNSQYNPQTNSVLAANRQYEDFDTFLGGGATALQERFNKVVDTVLPSVVELQITEKITQTLPRNYDFFPWFFGTPDQQTPDEEYETNSLGSGVIFKRENNTYYVLTNNHVAGKADKIDIVMNDQSTHEANLVGSNERRDLAVVSFTSEKNFPVARFGNSDNLKVGDWVLAMGSPYGYISSVTAGIVSALGRSGQQVNNINDFIQTDASINQGNSGGPLVNLNGEVIGINTWIAAPTGGNIGLGFSIPINNAKKIVDELIEFGSVMDGWLGVSMLNVEDLPESYSEVFTQKDGVFVANIFTNSPAYKGGLRSGDIITHFDGKEVKQSDEFSRYISNADINEKHEITALRNEEEKTFFINLDVRKPEEDIENMYSYLWPGVLPLPLTDEIRSELDIKKSQDGVAIYFMGDTVGTKLYTSGLRNLDIVTKINDENINSVQDFYAAVNDESADKFTFEFIRDGYEYFVGVVR